MAASESSGTTPAAPFVPPHNPTTPALTSALTIKQGNLFLLTEMDGNISEGKQEEREREMVGAEGFEPTTPASQTLCATRLRYAPT